MGLEELNFELGKIRRIHELLKREIEKEKPDRDFIKINLIEMNNRYGNISYQMKNKLDEVIGDVGSVILETSFQSDEAVRTQLNNLLAESDSFLRAWNERIRQSKPVKIKGISPSA